MPYLNVAAPAALVAIDAANERAGERRDGRVVQAVRRRAPPAATASGQAGLDADPVGPDVEHAIHACEREHDVAASAWRRRSATTARRPAAPARCRPHERGDVGFGPRKRDAGGVAARRMRRVLDEPRDGVGRAVDLGGRASAPGGSCGDAVRHRERPAGAARRLRLPAQYTNALPSHALCARVRPVRPQRELRGRQGAVPRRR